MKDEEIGVPLKHLSNFWRTLDIPLINCEVFLTLNWSANCIIIKKTYRKAVPTQRNKSAVVGYNNPTNVTFNITNRVTLSTQDNNKVLQKLKIGFKRTIKWNKYRSEMSNQTKNNNLSYLTDPTFIKVNILFFLSFENEDDIISFSKYYTSSVEIKNFNVLIDWHFYKK